MSMTQQRTDARIEVWMDETGDEWIVSREDAQGSDTLHTADDFDEAVRLALAAGRERDLPVVAQDNQDRRYHLDAEQVYAVIDRETGRVLAVHYDTRDAGSPTLRALMDRMQGSAEIDAPHHVRAWVAVDGLVHVGDYVDVDEDGAATPQHDPAAHRRAVAALAAAEAAHRRAMEAGDHAQSLRIERSALMRAARGALTRGELLEEIRALDARIEELEREASIEYHAAEVEAQRHRRAMDAFDRSVDA